MTTPQTVETIEFEQATSYRRVIARLIDVALGLFILLPLSLMLSSLVMLIVSGEWDLGSNWLFPSIWLLLLIAYDTLMHRLFGRTLGKIILGLRVVDIHGDKLDWKMCVLRAVLLYLSGLVIVFLIVVTASIFGWIFIVNLGKYKRFPHDTACHAFVVRESKGQLIKATGQAAKPTPLADLERLRAQGIISEEEFARKKNELGM